MIRSFAAIRGVVKVEASFNIRALQIYVCKLNTLPSGV